MLFEPSLTLPIKTLDVPLAGSGYGSQVLPFLFDLVIIANEVPVADSSKKGGVKDDVLTADEDGSQTVKYLNNTRSILNRISSTHPSSLGIHPALYFYSHGGVFQAQALLSFILFIKGMDTSAFVEFTRVRASFEEFMLTHRISTQAVRQLGSGSRSRPRMVQLYRRVLEELQNGAGLKKVVADLARTTEYGFLFVDEGIADAIEDSAGGTSFGRNTKGAAYLRDALPTALKCATCGGLLHKNGMQTGHATAKRDGGKGRLDNAILQHPFCNSTVRQ